MMHRPHRNQSGGPDGRTIVFVRFQGAVRTGAPFGPDGQIAHAELFVMRADGSHLRRITNITRSKPYSADLARAAWSPDGARLAFSVPESARGTPARKQALFIIRADGSGLKRLTPWQLHTGEHPPIPTGGRQPQGERLAGAPRAGRSAVSDVCRAMRSGLVVGTML
jgi:Tol biopolymer transport system component